VSSLAGFRAGVTMASLDAPSTTYTLQSYDIFVNGSLTGSFYPGGSASVRFNTYSALSLGSTMSALTSSSEPSNDLFSGGATVPPGNGPDPATGNINTSMISGVIVSISTSPQGCPAGTSAARILTGPDAGQYDCFAGHPYAFSVSQSSDLGCAFASSSRCSGYTPITNNLLEVEGAGSLDFYLSTLTQESSSSQGLTLGTQTAAGATVTVVYDYTTQSGAPEPASFALTGVALIGLVLVRKRTGKR
jgi:hypothetical protein